MAELQRGNHDAAWDLFLDRYRRLVFAAIRHYAQDYDDVMDVFARVCESLREDNLRRLRTYFDQRAHTARFSTWLVTVVRNLTIDWFRHRDGRRRLSALANALPPLRRSIFEHVFLHKRSHVEAFELMRSRGECPELSFGQFLGEVSATYRAAGATRQGSILGELGGLSPPTVDVDADTSVSEQREELEHALGQLSVTERVAVQLYVVEEMRAEAVAKVVGWPSAKTVYNHVYRALAAMRARISQGGPRAQR